jgi:pyruvate-ferredoxin/flavodoxin oxidoreductase
MLAQTNPQAAKRLFTEAQEDVNRRWQLYQYMAERRFGNGEDNKPPRANESKEKP